MLKLLGNQGVNEKQKVISRKVAKIARKTATIQGTGCTILSTLKHLSEVVEKQSIKARFAPVDGSLTSCNEGVN